MSEHDFLESKFEIENDHEYWINEAKAYEAMNWTEMAERCQALAEQAR